MPGQDGRRGAQQPFLSASRRRDVRTCTLGPEWLPRLSRGTSWATEGRLPSGESLGCHQRCPLTGLKPRGGGGTAGPNLKSFCGFHWKPCRPRASTHPA